MRASRSPARHDHDVVRFPPICLSGNHSVWGETVKRSECEGRLLRQRSGYSGGRHSGGRERIVPRAAWGRADDAFGRRSYVPGTPSHSLRGLVLSHRKHGAGERAVGLSQLIQDREVIGVGNRYQVAWGMSLRPVGMVPCSSDPSPLPFAQKNPTSHASCPDRSS
jgi:hypothetical protein